MRKWSRAARSTRVHDSRSISASAVTTSGAIACPAAAGRGDLDALTGQGSGQLRPARVVGADEEDRRDLAHLAAVGSARSAQSLPRETVG